MSAASPPVPAATLILFAGGASDEPQLLMIERARALAFAGGAMVFPGGRIDPGDQALAAAMGKDGDAAARVAAIRETIEETGVAVGLVPPPSPVATVAIRRRLHAGKPFATILAEAGIALDLDQLHPFARWLPAHAPARIFDTLFFLARAPADAAPTADATETTRLGWTSARALLAAADDGRATVIYPTRRNLERLAQFGSFDAAVADAAAFPVRTITPFVERRHGIDVLCIPDGCGYPITAEPLADAVRG